MFASTKVLLYSLIITFIWSCEEKTENPNELFSFKIENEKKTYKPEDILKLNITALKDKPVTKVNFEIDGVNISENNILLQQFTLGKKIIKASITSQNTTYTLEKSIIITASTPPKLYTYKIIERYPHDQNAYTQGLEFFNDTLYESTGQKGKSSLRKTDYKTGAVLKKIDLQPQYFGEGLTILNNKIFQLTWRENTGFIYDLATLQQQGTFTYNASKEGWGLCNNQKVLFKSDGTQKIWTLSPNNLTEQSYIEIYTHTSVIDNVNELEWVEGKIYANIYQKDAIAIVNPTNGAVEGVINLKGLQQEVTQHTQLDVLNGIAYKGEPNMLYVTGKNWDTLFKIEILEN